MFRNFLYIFVIIQTASALQAQDLSLYQKQWFVQNGDTMPLRILFPENFDATKSYPLVFFLHGRGERGTDNEKQLQNGGSLFLRDSIRKKHPAIVVFPQCPVTSYWSNVQTINIGDREAKRNFFFVADGEPSIAMKMAISLFDNLFVRYKIKRDQVYVMGLSMGGMGTYELVLRKQNVFAGAIPICGGANPAIAGQIRKTSWWIFHGGKDDIVSPTFSEQMVQSLKKENAKVKFTLFPNANHNSWDPAFAEPGLIEWLFNQCKK